MNKPYDWQGEGPYEEELEHAKFSPKFWVFVAIFVVAIVFMTVWGLFMARPERSTQDPLDGPPPASLAP